VSDRWRYACPEGHRAVRENTQSDGYYCDTCNTAYSGDPVDLKRREVSAA
jgi:hypothetical protein